MATKNKIILERVREILAKPESWIQGQEAMDAGGNDRTADDPQAVCFCLSGACKKAAHEHGAYFIDPAMVIIMANAMYTLPQWNDKKGRTHSEVLAAIDKAITAADTVEPFAKP